MRAIFLNILWKLLSSSKTRTASEVGEKITLLRSFLRRFPYWAEGHLLLARFSLQSEDISAAYASLQAHKILQNSGAGTDEANLLLAQCFMKRGDLEQAKALLRSLIAKNPQAWQAKEDLASCLVLTEQYQEARGMLLEIPQNHLSAEAAAMCRYLEKNPEPGESPVIINPRSS